MANVEVKQLYTTACAVQTQRMFFFSSLRRLFSRHLLCQAAGRAWHERTPLRTAAMLVTRLCVPTRCARGTYLLPRALIGVVAVVAAVLRPLPHEASGLAAPGRAFAAGQEAVASKEGDHAPRVAPSGATPDARARTSDAHKAHAADSGFWLVSTRGRRGCEYAPRVDWCTCASGCRPSSLQALRATDDPGTVTVIYVHGNDTSSAEARRVGLAAYKKLRIPQHGQHVRFIAWSWPSDRVRGRIARDARIKAAHAEIEGYQLARFLSDLSPGVPVSLVGFSFGARVITAAAHLLGGGSVRGQALDAPAPQRPLRAVLLAAGLDRDWIVPGNRHGQALAACERMLVLVNHQDRVLRYYPLISDYGCTEALGYAGAPIHRLGEYRERVVQWNVNPYVRRAHGWETYLYHGTIAGRIRQEALFQSD